MKNVQLGNQGLKVSRLGLGCMGMSHGYGKPDDAESLRVLDCALDLGINFWDTAEMYGPFKNETLLGEALLAKNLKSRSRSDVIIATKFAWEIGPNGERGELNSSPAHIKKSVEGSLKRLGTDYIDLYYQHRLDPKTPIEDTVGALSDLIREGKVRYIGLSEVGPAIIRRAHAVHPLSAVQSEYSLWERGVEGNVLPTLKELQIGFVAYSPMGRGLLTGTIQNVENLEVGDSRRAHPRFQKENLEHNNQLVQLVRGWAEQLGATPTQLALAWLLSRGENIVPIPGTKRLKYIEENARATDLILSAELLKEIDLKLSQFSAAGLRYSESMMNLLDTST